MTMTFVKGPLDGLEQKFEGFTLPSKFVFVRDSSNVFVLAKQNCFDKQRHEYVYVGKNKFVYKQFAPLQTKH